MEKLQGEAKIGNLSCLHWSFSILFNLIGNYAEFPIKLITDFEQFLFQFIFHTLHFSFCVAAFFTTFGLDL